jgi:phosphatidylethanolamine-binding protein (PEBP) family uncharacterized protein
MCHTLWPASFEERVPDAKAHVSLSRNRNPHLAWSGANVRAALAGHVLAQAHLSGTYTLNPRLP